MALRLCYELIHDESEIQKFVNLVCGDLSPPKNNPKHRVDQCSAIVTTNTIQDNKIPTEEVDEYHGCDASDVSDLSNDSVEHATSEQKATHDSSHSNHTYNVINDRVKVISLYAREKYVSKEGVRFGSSNIKLKRELLTMNDASSLIHLIRQCETAVGTLTYWCPKSQGFEPVPNKSLVIYFDLNSKSLLEGWNLTNIEMEAEKNQIIRAGYIHDPLAFKCLSSRLISQLKTNIQKSKNAGHGPCHGHRPTKYMDLDIDTKCSAIIGHFVEHIFPALQSTVVCIVETCNGYHMVFNLSAFVGKQYMIIDQYLQAFSSQLKFQSMNRTGDACMKTFLSKNATAQLPLPGTYQGGFAVKLISIASFLDKYSIVS